jgi:predicted RNA-binding protein with PUA-like domain
MNYWLVKSEPTCYSIDDLKHDKTAAWSGVRNYQARNFINDMKVSDQVLFYHSSADEIGVTGVATVTREAYPDHTALDTKDDHYDPKATKAKPIWTMVDLSFKTKFKTIVSLNQIKRDPKLDGMMVAQRGSRLSVQPVSSTHFKYVARLGSGK